MKLDSFRRISNSDGPFATVYLEGRAPGEDAEQKIRLRWDELRTRLLGKGTQNDLLDALSEAIAATDIGTVKTNGSVLVATATGALVDEAWDAALGGQAVRNAVQNGAMDRLLLEGDSPVTNEAAILAASDRTDADVGPTDTPVTDGVAAVLRFAVPNER